MKIYTALLRGINVGGNSKVEMSKLKEIFVGLGFTDVRTYINSGNVIFSSKQMEINELTELVQKTLKKKFGFEIKVLIINEKTLLAIEKKVPAAWTNDTNQRTDVIFLWNEFDKKATLKEVLINPEVDNLLYTKGAIIWNLKKEHYAKSKMRNFIGTTVYKNMTARNINTVRKLVQLTKSAS